MIGEWLLALHILGAVLWVGGLFFLSVILRPSLTGLQPADHAALSLKVFRKFFLVTWHAMPIMLATGYAMVTLVYGGFANIHWNVNVMHLLGLIMTGIFLWIFFVPWKALRAGGGIAAMATIHKFLLMSLVLGLITVVVSALNY